MQIFDWRNSMLTLLFLNLENTRVKTRRIVSVLNIILRLVTATSAIPLACKSRRDLFLTLYTLVVFYNDAFSKPEIIRLDQSLLKVVLPMFELILMRHAKSGWNNNLSDKNRTLNTRGIEDAQKIGAHLAKLNLVPDTIIVSAAQRTQQTINLMLDDFNIGAMQTDTEQLIVIDELYLASASTMLALIKKHAIDGQRLMVLAHNPGMDELVMHLASKLPKLTASGQLMVTCSAAVLEIEGLNDLKEQGSANLVTLLRPKEITF